MVKQGNNKGGKIKSQYRIIDYKPNWYLEKLKSPGVWSILETFRSEEEAKKKLEEVENGE